MMNSPHPSDTARSSDAPAGQTVELDLSFPTITREKWQEVASASLPPDTTLDSLARQTLDGLTIQVLYDQEDTPTHTGSACTTAKAADASPTATQGNQTSWDNRFSVAADQNQHITNRNILQGLAGGNTSIELHVDANSQLDTLLKGVNLAIAPVSFRPGVHYAAIEQQLHELIAAQSSNSSELICYFNADPLGHWLGSEQKNTDIDSALAHMAAFTQASHRRLPRSRSIVVDTSIHHNAGASARQELQAAVATGVVYMEALLEAGLSFSSAARQLVFHLACDADLLMGVVKLRALRVLWQHTLEQLAQLPWASEANHQAPEPMCIVTETSQRYLTHLDPWNNHLRNVAACSAAAMGDAHTIIVHPHNSLTQDEDEEAVTTGLRMARNLPIILERESALRQVRDPFAGAYAIEALTSQLAELCWQSLTEAGDSSAWIASLASGQWQQALAETHHRRLQLLHKEEYVMVGVNRYRPDAADALRDTPAATEPATGFRRLTPVRDAQRYEACASANSTPSQGEAPAT